MNHNIHTLRTILISVAFLASLGMTLVLPVVLVEAIGSALGLWPASPYPLSVTATLVASILLPAYAWCARSCWRALPV